MVGMILKLIKSSSVKTGDHKCHRALQHLLAPSENYAPQKLVHTQTENVSHVTQSKKTPVL